jgi:hypothetical protein
LIDWPFVKKTASSWRNSRPIRQTSRQHRQQVNERKPRQQLGLVNAQHLDWNHTAPVLLCVCDRLCAYLLHDIRSASLRMISASSEDDATPKSSAAKSQEGPRPVCAR